jgi:hypothetical protein
MTSMKECDCSCHEALRKASEKQREARERGEFYSYHCDCYCCPAASFTGLFEAIKGDGAGDKS